MGGLLSFLSPALTTATQAAGAQSQGDMDAQARQQAQTMQLIALARQRALDEQNATEGTARANYYNSFANQRSQPVNNWHYEPPTVGSGGQWVNPVTQETRPVDGSHPLPFPPQREQSGTGTVLPGSGGKPAQLVITSGPRMGRTIPVPDVDKATGGKGGAPASALTMQALSRMRQLSGDLASTIPQMESFENPNSPRNITQVGITDAALGTAADAIPNPEAHGAIGMAGNVLSTVGSRMAQKQLAGNDMGQAWRTYSQNAKRTGLGLTEILPRPNNALLGIERDLSAVDMGQYNAQNVANVQARRRNAKKAVDAILHMNPQFVEAMLKQDPDWLNNTLASSIQSGAMPTEPASQEQANTPGIWTDPGSGRRYDLTKKP